MKKLIFTILSLSVLFTSSASAVDVSDSSCKNFAWDTSTAPQSDLCFDIQYVQPEYILYNGTSYYGYYEEVKGYQTSTYFNHEGSYLYIYVDVFGVPNTEPTVMYKYRTLPIVASENIVNSSGGNIINGKRYVFAYYQDANWGAIDSGDIIVKKYATVVDSLHVQ